MNCWEKNAPFKSVWVARVTKPIRGWVTSKMLKHVIQQRNRNEWWLVVWPRIQVNFVLLVKLLLWFDLWNSAWGIQTVQTEISNTKHLWLFKMITPIAACLYYWVSVLKGSDFLPAKCFCRRLHATFLVRVYYDCGRKSDVWMNLSGRQTQLCMTLFLTCLLSEMLAKQLHR